MNVNFVSRSLVLQKFGDEKQQRKMREFELQKFTSRGSVPLICIKITSSSGKESNLTVSLTDTVNAVKDKALGGEYSKESPLYKLILSKSNRELIDEKTLEEENVQENDELILFRKRHNTSCGIAEKECKNSSYQVPDLKSVKKFTAKLTAGKVKEPSVASLSPLTLDFNSELRRILISLIDSSILLQSVNAEKDTDSSGQPEEDVQPNVDPSILKQLTDMGFKETRAKKALILNRMSPMLAMEWLLQHESDADIDEPLVLGARAGRTRRKRKEFVPNPRAVNNLKEMGFQEEEILMALKATGNNQEAACDWLLGDRQGGIGDVNEGLDQSSPLYQAIMENPLVQLSLSNARVLGAFEDMLENPSTSSFYINDPETGPVLLQVSRIVQGFAR